MVHQCHFGFRLKGMTAGWPVLMNEVPDGCRTIVRLASTARLQLTFLSLYPTG
jgi:hypothetical protein